MKKIILSNVVMCFLVLTLPFIIAGSYSPDQNALHDQSDNEIARKTIRSIHISGNNLITKEAILARVPFRPGDNYSPVKTGDIIRNLYNLKYFNTISVETEEISPTQIDLYIVVEEKKKVESIIYEGNILISSDTIEKELKLSEVPTMDEEELELYAEQIKTLYAQKNYHSTTLTTELQPTDHGTYIAVFTICEGPQAVVKRVFFEGNTCIKSKTLRKLIFTREDWLFGFLNKAGTFQPEMLDVDKFIIENFYQSNGFLAGRVLDINVDTNQETQEITVTYTIEEGPLFTISQISAPGNSLVTEQQLLAALPITPGQLYSKDLIRQSIDQLRTIWGQFGYIYADIEPIIIPNFETKTVDITFNSELGNKVFLNRITLCGNTKTRDYVIRRMLTLCEGELLTLAAMDDSKNRVEALGYFEPQAGVVWNITKISENSVDLNLNLKEIKTGRINGQIGYGGADPQSPSTALSIGASISDRNLFGTGIRFNLSGNWSKQDRQIALNFYNPWLFNRPIGGGLGFYHRSSFYDDFQNITTTPREKLTGGDAQLLFYIPGYPTISTSLTGGIEHIGFQRNLFAERGGRTDAQVALNQSFIDRRFASGTSGILSLTLGEDIRNHPVFPNRGYNWSFVTRFGVPAGNSTFGYLKGDLDVTWLTPLIGDYDLVFLLHGHAGIVGSLSDKLIPYRELYNIGGPGSVRGFDFGQIGPQVAGSSVGAKKAFWVNAELIFSITKDQSLRGILFYDGGAGWDTPLTATQKSLLLAPSNVGALTNNRFRYRHSIGFGIRLLNPAPIRIDWGFKLDRNKRLREKFYEVHFSMDKQF